MSGSCVMQLCVASRPVYLLESMPAEAAWRHKGQDGGDSCAYCMEAYCGMEGTPVDAS